MALNVGTRLGHYDVTALIGEGGMGQVWQATDTQLNRQVALKILPDAFAKDAERLARFKREAQILASLNHPNFAAIYGIEEPGERHLIFTVVLREGQQTVSRLAALDLDTRQYELLPVSGSYPRYLATGHLLFGYQDTVWAVAFDVDNLKVAGDPVPVIENVVMKGSGAVNFDVSTDGTLAYVPRLDVPVAAADTRFGWLTRDGVDFEPVGTDLWVSPTDLRLSLNGRRLAAVVVAVMPDGGFRSDVWIYDLLGGRPPFPLAFDGRLPTWTPDGNRIVYSASYIEPTPGFKPGNCAGFDHPRRGY